MPTGIQFTQEQARSLARLSPGDLRHWRRVVPYLAGKPGKSARFTFADVLGLAITREIVAVFGVHISAIGPSVDALFHLLADERTTQLQGMMVLIGTDSVALLRWSDVDNRPAHDLRLLVPCDALLARMQSQMLPSPVPPQQPHLPFSPHVIRRTA